MSRWSAALGAGCATVLFAAGTVLAAPMDMSPPTPWTDSGAKPFVERDAQNKLTAIGLVIPAATVQALPKARAEAVSPMNDAGLVKSANLQWHPRGHEPEHVYDVPHFDVHFYTISEGVRHGIVPGAKAGKVRPKKAILPPNSILAPGFVPGMGMHDVPKAQPEFNGGHFTISPLIGYWNGRLAFFEVMFTKAWLEKKQDKSGTFPQPASAPQPGLYPTRYSVHYDKDQDAYRVALTDFRLR